MKRIYTIIGTILLLLFGILSNSHAYTFDIEDFTGKYSYGDDGTGSNPSIDGKYLGTVYGTNNSEAVLLDFLNWRFLDQITSVEFLGKTDENTLYIPDAEYNNDGEMASGTWQTYPLSTPPATPDVLQFLIVKGSNSFSVHYYDPAASYGEWNVGRLDDNGNSGSPPALSHLSADIKPTSVPEPATMLLLGTGLISLAAIGRRRFKN